MELPPDLTPGDILEHHVYDSVVVVGSAAGQVEALHPVVGRVRIPSADAKLLLPHRAALKIETGPDPWPVVARAVPGIAIWAFAKSEALAEAANRYWRRTKRREDIALLAAAIRRFSTPGGSPLADLVLGAGARPTGFTLDRSGGGGSTLRRTARADVIEFVGLLEKQIAVMDGLRTSLGQPSMTPRQLHDLAGYLISKPGYQNHCWDCPEGVHSSVNPVCPVCGWLVCVCGACKQHGLCSRYRRDRGRADDLGDLPY